MTLEKIDLPQLASVAGATVGLAIATAILLSWLTSRYTPNFQRYRDLCREYRQDTSGDRRSAVHDQIITYQRRLRLINLGVSVLCFALLAALVGIISAALSTLVPHITYVPLVGVIGLFTAFGLFAVAILLSFAENVMDRMSIGAEVRDLDVPGR